MTDSTRTLDISAYYAELHGWNERTLLARIERAVHQDEELFAGTDAAALTGLVQSVVTDCQCEPTSARPARTCWRRRSSRTS
ncbi:hypothetical protein OG754_36965 [Streptomyces decoyicus]|uniref:hypothetical protein n=1 Tax=Streptomyces decoyicus TaxID=249567 RepID=UPI002E374DC9|nr:hypothetical protein [Streptomyces decoyicus]